jgi:hypothetical protein
MDGAAPFMEDKNVLMLALRIAIAWTAFSLLCLALWVLFLESGRFSENARSGKFHRKTAAGFGRSSSFRYP